MRIIFILLLSFNFAQAKTECDSSVASDCKYWRQVKTQAKISSRLYSPPPSLKEARALVVMLHGCTQTAAQFATSTQMNFLADRENFAVLYLQQNPLSNADLCWNWFDSSELAQSGAELREIVSLIQATVEIETLNPNKVYIVGFSAGAAMATNLLNCYTDLFTAAALHSSMPYASAHNIFESEAAISSGSSVDPVVSAKQGFDCEARRINKVIPTILFQGANDQFLNPKNADIEVLQLLELNDLLDDGVRNNSNQKDLKVVQQVSAVGDTYPYTLTKFGVAQNVQYVEVSGLNHAWSGGSPMVPFSDPHGPNASAMIWDFFKSKAKLPSVVVPRGPNSSW